MQTLRSIFVSVPIVCLFASIANGQQLYSNFPISGQISAFQVNGGDSVSQSFTLAAGGTIGEIAFGAWLTHGDAVNTISWAIGTAPYDVSKGSGVAGATSAFMTSNADGFDVDTVTFAIPGITLPAGTYYLTLSAAVSTGGNPVYWDINDAASGDSWASTFGHMSAAGACFNIVGISGTCATSFQLLSASTNLSASPTSLTFTNQPPGTTSAAQVITIKNNSSGAAATISGIGVSGTNAGEFAEMNTCPISPLTLAASGSCTISVTFAPTGAGPAIASITLTGTSPLSVGLSGSTSSNSSWPNGYTYQATFTVAGGQVPSAQTNFPALISGTYTDFATTVNGGKVNNTCTQTVGSRSIAVPCDLIFTSDAAGTMRLSWEYESYNAATGAVNVWVNAPSLSNGTVIYAWYGQAAVTALQTTPSAAWSNSFEAVYHLSEGVSASATQINDSTANGNNGTIAGTVQASQQQAGEIGGSVNFEGNTWVGLANPGNFSFDHTNSFSLSGWFKLSSNVAGTLLSKFPEFSGAGWALLQQPASSGSNPVFWLWLFGSSSNNYALASTPPVTMGAWHYVVATYSGTNTVAGMQIYVDGVAQTLTTLNNTLSTSMVNALPAAINGRAGPYQESAATMDELRVSTVGTVFSPAYVTASYNNQKNPGAFFTVATGLTNSGSGLPVVSLSSSSLSFANQSVGTTSMAQPITVTNMGPGALAISSIGITGTGMADFGQTNTCPITPNTIAVNGTCTISATFTPQTANTFQAFVTITDNGVGSPQSVNLGGTGTGVPSTVTLSTSSISFPNQAVGTTSMAQSITVTNNGPSALAISSIGITGTGMADFGQTNTCPITPNTIAVNGTCTISATFTPQTANTFQASVTITDNGVGSPQSVNLGGTGTGGTPPWRNGYTYAATFAVNNGQAPTAVTNFQALISGTWPDFATTANGGKVNNLCTQTVGNRSITVPCDLVFTDDAGGEDPLNWEFESYNPATGAMTVWVNVTSVGGSGVNCNFASCAGLYAWYGQPTVTTLQTTPSSVWSNNFEAVYHLSESVSATATQINDSTANGNNGTIAGTVQASQQQAGEIGGSLNFEGDTWIGLANPGNFSFDRTNSFSVSGWVNLASNTAGTLLSKFPATAGAGWALVQQAGGGNPTLGLWLYGSGSNSLVTVSTPPVATGVWHYVVATYSGTSTAAGVKIYVDGVAQTLTTTNNTLTTSMVNALPAAINGQDGPNQMSTATMDELRVSTSGTVLSQAYVTASYNNQKNPGAFFTVVTGLTN